MDQAFRAAGRGLKTHGVVFIKEFPYGEPRSIKQGEHCRHWLEQFKELGEVQVEDVDPRGFKCFEEGREKLCRVWLKMDEDSLDNLF